MQYPKLIALAAGTAAATGFEPLGLWFVTLAAFAVLMAVVADAATLKSALARGWWFGVGHFTLGMNWIAGAFRYQDAMPVWLGYVSVFVLALYLAVYPAAAAGLAWRWGRGRSVSALALVFAGSWLATEYLRATMFTGYAWNPLAVAFVDGAAASRWIGTYGVSALAVLAAGALVAAWRRRWLPTALLGTPLALSALGSAALVAPTPTDYQVRVVQPNTSQAQRHDKNYDELTFRQLAANTGQSGPVPRLVLWPEAATFYFLEHEDWARRRVAALLGPRDMLLTGGEALKFRPDGKLEAARSSMFVINPEGVITGHYDKAHLVPYGEYLPARPLLSAIGLSRLVPGDLDFLAGPGPQTHAVAGFGRVGTQICYEIVFSGQVVDRANRPDFIFNPSTDAWFGSWGPPQHLAQARLRAIEEALPVIRSTPTGHSAVIDAHGRLLAGLPLDQPGYIDARLPAALPPTLFARHGNVMPLALALLLFVAGVALRQRAR